MRQKCLETCAIDHYVKSLPEQIIVSQNTSKSMSHVLSLWAVVGLKSEPHRAF